MSADDPTDDELEREAARDVPLPHGGTGRHAPRLSTVSRAINPRALLMAEAEAQSAEPLRELPRPLMPYEVDPDPYRQGHAQQTPRDPRAEFLRALAGGRSKPVQDIPAPKSPYREREPELERAWDEFAAAALAGFIHHAPSLAIQDLAATAASCADALLDERRRRFR